MRGATPLVIGPVERAALRDLRERAAQAPVDIPKVIEAMKNADGKRRHLNHMSSLTIPVPSAFAVTFTIDVGHPNGTCRHMSMSSRRKGRLPTPEALWMVAQELGFSGALTACAIWTERPEDGGVAVNVVQPISVAAGDASPWET